VGRGCEKEDTASTTVLAENIDSKITARAELSIFQAALKKTRLDIFTKGGGPFTIWAPTNTAFANIGISKEADLNTLDSNLLVQILTYHIQAVSRSYNEIPLGPNANMVTQGGLTQYASRKTGGTAYINGAAVTEPNIQASNGYMHVINRVLVPPFFNMAASLALMPNYKLMLQAITRTATSTTTNPLTIFAVPNSVMLDAGFDSTAIASATGANLTALTAVIRYHVINKRIFSPDFIAGAVKTVQGGNILIGTGTSITVKGNGNASPFQVTSSDFVTTTGVIHSINGLLLP
jgi:uncharacterized surface protein with fasciclin (FAS1) repeats